MKLFMKCKKKNNQIFTTYIKFIWYQGISSLIDLLLSVHLIKRPIHTMLQFKSQGSDTKIQCNLKNK